jgi:flagellar motility protein MotE (MotC chaperone)
MSVTKSNNNMGGAYGNCKKKINFLESKIVLLESNQNGVRLKMDEVGNFKNIVMSSESPFRYPVSEVETQEPEEEDEEAVILRRRKERRAIQDMEDEALIKIARAKKMRKDIDPIRQTEIDSLNKDIAREEAEIEKRKANIMELRIEIEAVKNGTRDDELIKMRTDVIKVIAPTPKPDGAKPDGTRARNTKDRPNDIYSLFSKPTIIKIKMNETDYYGMVRPDKKIITACKANGTFNHLTDKGVISHLTKTIKLEGGKTKDVADDKEPAKERREWMKKDDWIKACKGEQGLYSSTKNGWKEISFKNDTGEWICLLETAYEGVKLN